MPNRNHLPNRNGADTGDSSDEVEQTSTTIRAIFVVVVNMTPIQQPTLLGQQVTDGRTTNPQHLTNEQIDELILPQPGHFEGTIPATEWFILMLFSCLIFYCWPLLIFTFIAYQLITYDNQPIETSHVSGAFDPNQDAEAEGRTGHPEEEDIGSSSAAQMLNPIVYGIQNVQAHGTTVLTDLNNTEHTHIVINTTNDGINPNIQNGANEQITTNEDNVPQTVVDDPRYNVNPLGSVESQDDVHSSDSSDEEDRIISSESGFDGDDEADSSDDRERPGRTVAIIENLSSPVQNHLELSQTNTTDEQPATTVPLHIEAVDIETNVTSPGDPARQVMISLPRSTGVFIPKSTNFVRSSVESSDEHNA